MGIELSTSWFQCVNSTNVPLQQSLLNTIQCWYGAVIQTFWLSLLFTLLTDDQIRPPTVSTNAWAISSCQFWLPPSKPRTCTPWKSWRERLHLQIHATGCLKPLATLTGLQRVAKVLLASDEMTSKCTQPFYLHSGKWHFHPKWRWVQNSRRREKCNNDVGIDVEGDVDGRRLSLSNRQDNTQIFYEVATMCTDDAAFVAV